MTTGLSARRPVAEHPAAPRGQAVEEPVIVRADARALPLPDNSVDLVVTSPPYFGLRSYEDSGGHRARQIGAESSPCDYVDARLDCTREMVRVLKPTGSLFVKLGDVYRRRSLLNIPGRFAIRAADPLGLHHRAEIVWSKQSKFIDARARDRARRTHETVFHFALWHTCFANVDAVLEPPQSDFRSRPQYQRAMELFEEAGFGHRHLDAGARRRDH